MRKFKMRWPGLNYEVMCEGIEVNEAALDILVNNMPIKTLQGHEMVGGRILRDRAVRLKKQPFDLDPESLETEKLKDAPVGRISLLSPLGSGTELLVKYDDCVDDRDYIPVAKVRDEDLEILKKAAKLEWQSATREQKTIIVQFAEVE